VTAPVAWLESLAGNRARTARGVSGRAPDPVVAFVLVVVAVLAVSASAGCSGGTSPPRPSQGPSISLRSLDLARLSFEAARATVLADVSAVTQAASVHDALDVAALVGAYDPASREMARAVTADAAVTAAVQGSHTALQAYATAIAELSTAATSSGLGAGQATAVTGLTAAARPELEAASGLLGRAGSDWKAYVALAAAQALWVSRAGAGFYPDQGSGRYSATVAAAAYTVLTNATRPALQRIRGPLALASRQVGSATQAVRAATAVVQQQLAPLLARPTPRPSATLAG
jgi:hypothetical protein